MKRLLGFTQSGYDPAARFRFIQFIPHLRKAGWEVDHRPNRPDRQWSSPLKPALLRGLHYRVGRLQMKANRLRDVNAASQFDVVFMNRDLAGNGLFFEQRLHRNNPRIVYDFDDAIYLGPNEAAVAWMCAHAAWVTPGNEYLAKFVRQHTDRFTIIPTIIDTDLYEPRDGATNGAVRVGWSGSDQSIRATLVPNLPMLRELQGHVDFELVVITNTEPKLPVDGLRWRYIPWRADDERRLGALMDIGIMPLDDNEFQRGKCALKLLQYMAAGLPAVASPVGVNAAVVLPGITGFPARTKTEWHEALAKLIRDAGLRARLGQAGRQRCVADYSVKRWLPVLLEILDKTAGEKR
jgi:glycosyltransferase involved in cell wall biosynthesis